MARNVNASYETSDNKRTPVMSIWTYLSGSLNNSYVASDSTAYASYNPNIKLATVSFNLDLTTLPSSAGVTVVSGLPKPMWYQCISFANGTTGNMRGYISADGNLVIDVVPSTTGWYAGGVSYAYSSIT